MYNKNQRQITNATLKRLNFDSYMYQSKIMLQVVYKQCTLKLF